MFSFLHGRCVGVCVCSSTYSRISFISSHFSSSSSSLLVVVRFTRSFQFLIIYFGGAHKEPIVCVCVCECDGCSCIVGNVRLKDWLCAYFAFSHILGCNAISPVRESGITSWHSCKCTLIYLLCSLFFRRFWFLYNAQSQPRIRIYSLKSLGICECQSSTEYTAYVINFRYLQNITRH